MGLDIANDVLGDLDQSHNVSLVHSYYRWNLIQKDWDDNKFIDCAIAGNADCIVTNDKHFNILHAIDFPRIQFSTQRNSSIYLAKKPIPVDPTGYFDDPE